VFVAAVTDAVTDTSPCPTVTYGGFTYDCIHRSGKDWNGFSKDLKHVANLLRKDGDCYAFLSSHVGAVDFDNIYLKHITDYYSLANSIENPSYTGRVDGTYGVSGPPTQIVISDVVLNSANERLTVLHELAHLVGAIPRDGSDPTGAASIANSNAIREHCAKTLGAK
jgi:hypothetical protein